ncbi:hypothetical protein KX928_08850 [Roseobacter sp. YSTF-M11]|uniref:Uncharacterized protein n=1 Tax=Roseobacter insulae TaxID=2859783 RepID=A0A9X1K2T3_9RHOB|nr:hypothetical protein [Roseobacter insulae]MBW4707892.1 hypothetical protein [Roseobacter insulae]
MNRWLWWAPLVLLITGLAVWGFRLGWIAATITETDVITTYAKRYLEAAGPGAALSDCVAYPGRDRGVWLVVRCGPDPSGSGGRYEYHVNRLGGLVASGGLSTRGAPAGRAAMPQT